MIAFLVARGLRAVGCRDRRDARWRRPDQLNAPLAAGLTPVVSYWACDYDACSMQWLDGYNGVCDTDDASSCPSTITMSAFTVLDL